ncbi:hypothetical protein [Haliscomenobacter hydrossis]|uniref:Response regulatory domain-containing protein n=1 Tax=Haliscomenobacter hydrossis (strain ATCC 27775 / DSM 1100 / LMG 10767 / O) TaxID=760192 RepID=F4KRZ8_HALH1|nr:hypothetical protein [Haliscomenobacter hydrossis]AEE51085.1 hypothetical protein Halhy_3225 [Haliscomenobacter hydrossis DSM 1100]
MYRVGYVDEDGGQKSTFFNTLKDDFEVKLFDITEETDSESLVEAILASSLDVLVLDFLLDETGLVDFNADELIEKIQEVNKHYPLIILTSREVDALDQIPDANLINGKEEMLVNKIDIFKQKLNKIASNYKASIGNAQKELEHLEEKREEKGLEPNEEDRYVELNLYLDQTVAAKNHISRTFYSEDTNKKLDELIAKTEELINKIHNPQ